MDRPAKHGLLRHGLLRSLTVLVAIAATLALTAATAGAVATTLQTFKTSIDVKLDVTERSIWHGIRPGCFAPQEDFDMSYQLRIDSTPDGKKSTVKNGVATRTPASFGVTPSYGDKKSFRQYSSASPWTLETQYPASCTGPAPEAPAWAVNPQCKKVSERVEATLLQSTIDDPSDPTSNQLSPDGALVLVRTPKARPTINGASIGESCFRTLHDIDPIGLDSNLGIDLKSTLISIPIPNLQKKLANLGDGSSKSHPSFRVPIRISGDCLSMRMRPSNGLRPDFVLSPFSQPHNALGSFNGDASKTICMISGSGSATVRREGKVVTTLVPITTR